MNDRTTPTPATPAPRKNRWGCGLFLAPLAMLPLIAVIQAKHWHPSDADWPTQGIDVSNHQGTIDWPKLPAQGVDFTYIKATEGGDFVDQSFAKNWAAANKAGMRRGAYHFFTLCRPGAEQAANFIATVPKAADALPPAVDLEYIGNCSQRPKVANVQAELATYLTTIEKHYGQKAVLYLTKEFDDSYDISARFDRPLWLRSLVIQPDFGAQPWHIWQVSNFRQLDGIDGRVDWNVMRMEAGE